MTKHDTERILITSTCIYVHAYSIIISTYKISIATATITDRSVSVCCVLVTDKVQTLVDFNEVPAEENLPLVCQKIPGVPSSVYPLSVSLCWRERDKDTCHPHESSFFTESFRNKGAFRSFSSIHSSFTNSRSSARKHATPICRVFQEACDQFYRHATLVIIRRIIIFLSALWSNYLTYLKMSTTFFKYPVLYDGYRMVLN